VDMILVGVNASPSIEMPNVVSGRVVELTFRVREVVVPVGVILVGANVSPRVEMPGHQQCSWWWEQCQKFSKIRFKLIKIVAHSLR